LIASPLVLSHRREKRDLMIDTRNLKEVKRDEGAKGVLMDMFFEWNRRGHPEKSAAIQKCLALGVEVPREFLIPELIPDGEGDEFEDLKPPPRAGRGSGVEEWRTFLFNNSKVEEEIVDSMSRDDIISMCEQLGLIEGDKSKVDSSKEGD
jgi:hypothetical protein